MTTFYFELCELIFLTKVTEGPPGVLHSNLFPNYQQDIIIEAQLIYATKKDLVDLQLSTCQCLRIGGRGGEETTTGVIWNACLGFQRRHQGSIFRGGSSSPGEVMHTHADQSVRVKLLRTELQHVRKLQGVWLKLIGKNADSAGEGEPQLRKVWMGVIGV